MSVGNCTIFLTSASAEDAIVYLEQIRWNGHPVCSKCESSNVQQHETADRLLRRWQCRDCSLSFSVTAGTVFHRTHKSLRDWFLLILALDGDPKPSISELAERLSIRRDTVKSMVNRLDLALQTPTQQKFITLVREGLRA
ncbi:transposase [Sphingomonas sp.]|uniref:transposase n=1 Tax=Sphingomonas sp. TaxID=28214 RepID=UPI0039C94A01